MAIGFARDEAGTTSFAHWSRAARIYRTWFDSTFAPPRCPSLVLGGRAIMGIDVSCVLGGRAIMGIWGET